MRMQGQMGGGGGGGGGGDVSRAPFFGFFAIQIAIE